MISSSIYGGVYGREVVSNFLRLKIETGGPIIHIR